MQIRCAACTELVESPADWEGGEFPCPSCGADAVSGQGAAAPAPAEEAVPEDSPPEEVPEAEDENPASGSRRALGHTIIALTVGIGSVLMLITVIDLVLVVYSRTGLLPATALGLGIRALIVCSLGALAIKYGLSLVNPARYSKQALLKRELEKFYSMAKLAERDWPEPPPSDINYAKHSNEELASVARNIDPEAAAKRYEAVLYEIKKRVEAGLPNLPS